MNGSEYRSFVFELCKKIGITDWETVAHTQHLCVDDRVVALFFDESVDPTKLYVWVDLGSPSENAEQLYKRLLELNLTPGRSIVGHFALDDESGSVIYVVPVTFTGSPDEASALARLLPHLARPLDDLLELHS
ncbi:CesT family type III secretion system chaperone [Burkholderia ubonensis]|uniref:CesT family type III secretion system chaperone n=1 Tax=Burkholderia ubonensis TaxID=101571 RepID=UPI0009B4AF56|nr:CesT family type III secretion system chaperone [Burkholderia ubonensis]